MRARAPLSYSFSGLLGASYTFKGFRLVPWVWILQGILGDYIGSYKAMLARKAILEGANVGVQPKKPFIPVT